ncbi:hypothetical protein ACFQY7_21550 [Actinomadura luteofluorescens]
MTCAANDARSAPGTVGSGRPSAPMKVSRTVIGSAMARTAW